MTDFPKTRHNRIRRLPERGRYDQETIYQILDEALICHVGFMQDEQPYVIPINFARMGDEIVFHGAKASRLLKHIAARHPVCIEATLVDGLVLARSVFHHSVNYRSAVLFGAGGEVKDDAGKLAALEAVTEHLAPGRWQEARRPTQKELDATLVVAVRIEEASAKVRSGPAVDDEEDYALPVWAGLLPLEEVAGVPEADDRLIDGIPVPGYVRDYNRKKDRTVHE